MAFSLNPIEVIKLFRDRGISQKAEVVEYLQVLADSANAVAQQWTMMAEEERRVPRALLEQSGAYKLLREHYRRASTVLAGRLPEHKLGELFYSIGTMMTARQSAKDALFAAAYDQRHEEALLKAAEILQEEAAILKALTAEIKFSKD